MKEKDIDKIINNGFLKEFFKNINSLEALKTGIMLLEEFNRKLLRDFKNYGKMVHEIINFTIEKFNKEENSVENNVFWNYYMMILDTKFKNYEYMNPELYKLKNIWVEMLDFIEEKILNKEYLILYLYNTKLYKVNKHIESETIKTIEDKIIKYYLNKIIADLNYVKTAKTIERTFPITERLLSELLDLFQKAINNYIIKAFIVESIITGRLSKTPKYNITHSLIFGKDGGLYALINSLDEVDIKSIINYDSKSVEYFQNKIKNKKITIGKGSFGIIRLCIVLLQSNQSKIGENSLKIGEILCVKKTSSQEKKSNSEIREMTLNDYFSNFVGSKNIYSPPIYDMNVIFIQDKRHSKGYTFLKFIMIQNGNNFLRNVELQKWKYQKPYLMDMFKVVNDLLNEGIAMTDLKPGNTLFEMDNKVGKLIDLAGAIKKARRNDLEYIKLNEIQEITESYAAPELKEIDLNRVVAYNFGAIIITDINEKLKELILYSIEEKLITYKITLEEALIEINKLSHSQSQYNNIEIHYNDGSDLKEEKNIYVIYKYLKDIITHIINLIKSKKIPIIITLTDTIYNKKDKIWVIKENLKYCLELKNNQSIKNYNRYEILDDLISYNYNEIKEQSFFFYLSRELLGCNRIDLTKSLSFSLGLFVKNLVLSKITEEFSKEDLSSLKNLVNKMLIENPLERISIEEGLEILKTIGTSLELSTT